MPRKQKDQRVKRTSIGGQAVLEGVMMRGKTAIATAVRDEDGVIRLEAERLKPNDGIVHKIPVVRGAVNFFASLVSGMKVLMRSAEVYGEDTGEPSKFEKWLAKTFKIDVMNVVMAIGVILGIAFSVGLFFVLPHFAGKLFAKYVSSNELLRNLAEGLLRIAIFVCYILLTSLMKDIRRTYMYHGAEHKTITCYEKGLPLTVENVQKCRRVHDRCGTTFMFFVMFVSILVYSFFGSVFHIENGGLKLLVKLALLPLVAGLSYELLKALAKTQSPLVLPLKLPGLALQKITTREPDDGMAEVAITAFCKVLSMDENPEEQGCRFVCAEKLSSVKKRVEEKLAEKGIDGADGEWILCEVTGKKRSELSEDCTLSAGKVEKIDKLLEERLTGKPLWYILGTCNFYGYDFKVDGRVLIPRPETEELVSEALKLVKAGDRVLDLCTGSGAIAVTVALKTGATVVASDVSADAVALAKENALRLGANVEFLQGDLFGSVTGVFDVILSNPPYIPTADIAGLQTEVKDHEPMLALDGGEDGLDFYRRIAAEAGGFLKEGGTLLLEVGEGEAEKAAEMLRGFCNVRIIKDLEGIERIVAAVKL